MAKTMNLVREPISFGWRQFKKASARLIGVVAVAISVSVLSSLIFGEVAKTNDAFVSAIAWIADLAIQTLIGVGFIALALKAHDHVQRVHALDLWAPEHFLRYLGAKILVGIIVIIGFILLVIPGLIAMVILMFTPYLVVDKKLGPVEAMKKSKKITRGHRWSLFLLVLVIALLNLVGSLVFLVGLLVTIPISILAITHAYRTITL